MKHSFSSVLLNKKQSIISGAFSRQAAISGEEKSEVGIEEVAEG